MHVVVYYSSEFESQNLVQPPQNVLRYLISVKDLYYQNFISKCPAITNYYKNVFSIFPTFDYILNCKDDRFFSEMYDQKFYDDHVLIRNLNKNSVFFSYSDPPMYFFTEEKSLLMETVTPSLHLNSNNYNIVQGCFDIGKHLRKVELPVIIKNGQSFVANRKDPLYYLKFHTNTKIELKRFIQTKELIDIVYSIMKIRNHTNGFNSLSFYYDLIEKYKLKNKIIQIIKQNLID